MSDGNPGMRRARQADRPLSALLLAAGLALWLLWRPELVQALPWPWRGGLVAWGGWALGAAFARPLLDGREGRLARLAASAGSRAALVGFGLVLAGRALFG